MARLYPYVHSLRLGFIRRMELEGAKSFGKAIFLEHPGSLESIHDGDRTRFGTFRSLDKESHHTGYSVPMCEVYIREQKRAQGDFGYFIPGYQPKVCNQARELLS